MQESVYHKPHLGFCNKSHKKHKKIGKQYQPDAKLTSFGLKPQAVDND